MIFFIFQHLTLHNRISELINYKEHIVYFYTTHLDLSKWINHSEHEISLQSALKCHITHVTLLQYKH